MCVFILLSSAIPIFVWQGGGMILASSKRDYSQASQGTEWWCLYSTNLSYKQVHPKLSGARVIKSWQRVIRLFRSSISFRIPLTHPSSTKKKLYLGCWRRQTCNTVVKCLRRWYHCIPHVIYCRMMLVHIYIELYLGTIAIHCNK